MSNVFEKLQPAKVFEYFGRLTEIPRCSGNEQAVSDYLVEFAEEHNLKVTQDEVLNIIIEKEGTEGRKNDPTVILQGHLDMVCAKEEGIAFDFDKDPIPVVVEDDMIKTEGTTLGADNGIAVAMTMAILASDTIEHPPIKALFTVGEEVGMDGVLGLEKGSIDGDILINIDSEEEGTILASCAGGVRTSIQLPIEKTDNDFDLGFKLKISGLKGGHSGMEIDKNRASALKLMGRLLENINEEMDFAVNDISGGEKMNAIPKRATAKVFISESYRDDLLEIIDDMAAVFANEYSTADPTIQVEVEAIDNESQVFTEQVKNDLIFILRLIPQGIQTMSNDIEGLVESSNNLGVVTTTDEYIDFDSAVRSSVKSLKREIYKRMKQLAVYTNSDFSLKGDYPEWQFEPNSKIRDIMSNAYLDMYGEEIQVEAIHAGLECGFLQEKLEDIDMISMGPNIYDVHTPNEHLSISSVKRTYEFLLETLKRIK